MPLAYVGLGSNLGDRQAYLYAAIDKLHALPGTIVVRTSGFHESPAVDSPPGSPAYLNGVAEVRTELEPLPLLRHLLAIERHLGRERPPGVVNAPRTLDLDLIAYGGETIESPELTVPHPRMHERPFVLTPLAELAPSWYHPILRKTASELHDAARSHAGATVVSGETFPAPGDARGLTRFDRIAGGIGVIGCIMLSLFMVLVLFLAVPNLYSFGGPSQAVMPLFFIAWIWIGTVGIVRYSVVAHRLDKLLRTSRIGETGRAFEVETGDGALDAEVVASGDEGLPDDRGAASGPA